MAQLLLELFSEEIPARMQARACDDLKRLVSEALEAAGLSFDKAAAYATPRRIALVVDGLPDAQPDISEEKRGPRTDAPEKAIEGFLRANEISLEQCEKRTAGKGEFWFAVIERKGRPTAEVLAEILPDAIRKLPWQKSMRWGEGSLRWVRPLQRILCVLDAETVALDIGGGVPCGNTTSGHRFHSPEPFEVGFFDDYEKTLQLNKVVLQAAHRRDLIEQGANELVADQKLQIKRDAGLLAEVAGLVEWPVVLLGNIDNDFMILPDEVLSTSMRSHQKYFSVIFEDGKLAPFFVVVANMEASDGGAAIVAGNERVLRARLSDAKFFWDQDRKETLESRVPALAQMVFHQKLGTLEDKVTRLTALATEIVQWVPGADRDQVRSAATLCKADLTSGMVGEFAELQGIMGRYYALAEGEAAEVADAIAEHYSPAGPDDDCPTKPVSIAVSLADKLDTLVGFFGIDEKPTGSRDPFALRRAALGIIRIILENNLAISTRGILEMAQKNYPKGLFKDSVLDVEHLWTFIVDRLKVHLRGRGVSHDLIAAIFARGGEDQLLRLVQKAEALQEFLATEDGKNLLVAYRRANNIVQIEEKKDGVRFSLDVVDENKFEQHEENALWNALTKVEQKNPATPDMAQFGDVLEALASLRAPVDQFFDKVTVNTDKADLRENRLRLLSEIGTCLNRVADFSQIEG